MVPPPAPARRTMDPRLQGPPNGLGNEYKYFTPSDINAYFHFACQLQLWKSFHERHGPGVRSRPPALKTAHMKRGYLWEKLIVERLDQRNLILRFSSTTSLREQIERDTRDHFYIIGSSFNNPDLFRDEYISRNQTPVKFGSFKPDFIEVWKRNTHGKLVIEYHVIDAKASYKGVHVILLRRGFLCSGFPSSSSLLLLARFERNTSVGHVCRLTDRLNLAPERRRTSTLFTACPPASNGCLSILASAERFETPVKSSALALQCCLC